MWAYTVCCSSLTCTMAAMSMGSIARGNRRMLKRDMEVKAFSAVNTFFELTPTNTANVTRETCGKRQHEKKRPPLACRFASFFARLLHRTHQSRSTGEDEGGDRRQVGKLPHDIQLLPPNAFYLRLEGWLPCIQLQNLVGGKKDEEVGRRSRGHCGG